VLRPLLGTELADAGELIRVDGALLAAAAAAAEPSRPAARASRTEVDTAARFAVILQNHNIIAPYAASSSTADEIHCALRAASPAFCVEIKPKCGFVPAADLHGVSRFQMHQALKVANGEVTRVSRYNPPDLFLGVAATAAAAASSDCIPIEYPPSSAAALSDCLPIEYPPISAAALSDCSPIEYPSTSAAAATVSATRAAIRYTGADKFAGMADERAGATMLAAAEVASVSKQTDAGDTAGARRALLALIANPQNNLSVRRMDRPGVLFGHGAPVACPSEREGEGSSKGGDDELAAAAEEMRLLARVLNDGFCPRRAGDNKAIDGEATDTEASDTAGTDTKATDTEGTDTEATVEATVDVFVDVVVSCLARSGVLARLLAVQRLDRVGVEGASELAARLAARAAGVEREVEVTDRQGNACWVEKTDAGADADADALRDFIVAATAKDCSVMLALRRLEYHGQDKDARLIPAFGNEVGNSGMMMIDVAAPGGRRIVGGGGDDSDSGRSGGGSGGVHYKQTISGGGGKSLGVHYGQTVRDSDPSVSVDRVLYQCHVAIVDLDMKSVNKLPAWLKLERDIVSNYTRMTSAKKLKS